MWDGGISCKCGDGGVKYKCGFKKVRKLRQVDIMTIVSIVKI
jgi:hypothetical protein